MSQVDLEDAYDKWAEELVGYATSLVGSGASADVVADVFANLVALGPSRWNAVDDQRGFLFRCVLNASRMHARTSSRQSAREQRVARLATTRSVAVDHHVTDDAWVGPVFELLSVQQRAVIYHTYWDDLTPALTAELMGVSVGTVKRQLARGRSKLRKELS